MFDQTAKDYMLVGGAAAAVGTATQVALTASGVALSTTAGTMTVASAGSTATIPLLSMTGWGVLAMAAKVTATLGGGMFIYGFGRGVARGISSYRAERRAVKAEQGK